MPNLEWDVFIKDASNIIFDTNQLTFVPRRINKPAKHRLDHRTLAPLVFHFCRHESIFQHEEAIEQLEKAKPSRVNIAIGSPCNCFRGNLQPWGKHTVLGPAPLYNPSLFESSDKRQPANSICYNNHYNLRVYCFGISGLSSKPHIGGLWNHA